MAANTWAEALRDPTVPVYWLLRIGGAGAPHRFAEVGLDIEGKRHTGGLVMQTPPAIVVDPYTSRASVTNCVLSILPVEYGPPRTAARRAYDIEAEYRTSLMSLRAEVYQWAYGTPLSEAKRRIRGHIRTAELAPDGTLRLEIADSVLRHNRELPRGWVTEERWTAPYADDLGKGYSIIFGRGTKVPCPVCDTSGQRAVIAEGVMSSLASARLDDATAADGALTTATDGKGSTVSLVDFSSSTIGDQRVDVTVDGYADIADADLGTYAGYWTGTSGALLEHPADQMHYLARKFASFRGEDVDRGSFVGLRADLPGYVAAIQVMSDFRTSFFALAADTGALLRTAFYPEGGLYTARHLSFTRPYVAHLRDGENIIARSDISWGDRRQLITSLVVRYAWRWLPKLGLMDFARTLEIDDTESAGFAKNRLILRGESDSDIDRRRVIETKIMQGAGMAGLIGSKLEELHGKPRKQIEVTCTREELALRIYDTVRVTLDVAPSTDGAGMVGDRYVITGIVYDHDKPKLKLLEC